MREGRTIRRGALALAGLGSGLVLAGCGMEASAASGPRPPEKVYSVTCGYCHGKNVGPIIKGRELPPEAVKMMVRHGMGGMPAFRPTEITDAELDGLATYISQSEADPAEHGQ